MRPFAAPTLVASLLLSLCLVACGGGGGGGGGTPGGSGGSGGDGGTGGGDGGTGGSGGGGLPAIDALEPDHGMIGSRVKIHGRHFARPASQNEVYFNGQVSMALSVDEEGTLIETAVPLNASTGPVKVIVAGVHVDGPTFTVDPYPAPHLTSVSPERTPLGEDVLLVLTGSEFRPNARVLIDGGNVSAQYRSSTRFEVTIAGSQLARRMTHTVQVVVDPPGGGGSETLSFDVVDRFRLLKAEPTSATGVDLTFGEALVQAAATDVSNYSLTPALTVRAAARDTTNPRIVHLETDPQAIGVRYQIGAEEDLLSDPGNLLAAGRVSFLAFGSPPEHAVALGVSGCDGFSLSGPGILTPAVPGGFYVTERTGHQVQILDAFGAGRGYLGHDGTDARRHDGTGDNAAGCPDETGATVQGAFRLPRGAVGRFGNGDLVIADTGNDRVQRWSSGGQYLGTIGDFTAPVVLGRIGTDMAIANRDDRIYLYSASGLLNDTVGGSGDTLGKFAFGTAAGETPAMAEGTGVRYLTDPGNHRVVRLVGSTSDGFLGGGVAGFRTAGSCCAAGSGAAAFDSPRGVAIDSAGRLLVVDAANGGRLQRFTADGQPDYEMPLGYVPGGIAIGQNDLGDYWLISEPAGDKIHSYQP